MCNVLLGGAIGDALGVFAETKPADCELIVNWDGETFLGSEHHGLKPGQFTDDTQFSTTLAKSLIENNGFNPDDLSKRYVDLFDSGIIRGYGKTTLLAINNLRSGKHWSESGIVGSYGNGSAMRSAPFGIYFRNDLNTLINVVKIDSAITHASEDAEAGAIAIAVAAYYAVNHEMEDLLDKICECLPNSKVKNTLSGLNNLINSEHITPPQALKILGTSCNVCETVPSVLYCFLKIKSYKDAVIAAIKSGGDTDTHSSIIGALFGAKDGIKSIPNNWIDEIEDRDKLINLDSQLFNRSNKQILPRN